MALDNLLDILFLYMTVPDPLRIDNHTGPLSAGVQTPRGIGANLLF